MVGERSPKPSMWVRFLPSVQSLELLRQALKKMNDIASDSTLAAARAGLLARNKV